MAAMRMCGVVLWSCRDDGRAVIWCEDHGKLAFYAAAKARQIPPDPRQNVALDAGDLIEFDVEDECERRRAHNPRLLVADHAPFIATELRQRAVPDAQSPAEHGGDKAHCATCSAEIVPFKPRVLREPARAVG